MNANIGIVGGGIHGMSAAEAVIAADPTATVTLFERDGRIAPKGGSSSGMTRAWRPNYGPGTGLDLLYGPALAAYRTLETATSRKLVQMRDCLELGEPGWAKYEAMVKAVADGSFPRSAETWTAETFSRFFPRHTLNISSAFVRKDCGTINAAATMTGLTNRTVGPRFTLRNADVEVVEQRGSRVVVHHKHGDLEFDHVLIAAGCGSGPLIESAGLVFAGKRPWATEETVAFLKPQRVPAWLSGTGDAPERLSVFSLMCKQSGGFACIWQPETGTLRILERTTGSELAKPGDRTSVPNADSIARSLAFLEQLDPDTRWTVAAAETCLYEWSPDYKPLIGAITDRIWVDALWTGAGFKFGPYVGSIIARAMLGLEGLPDLVSHLTPLRFKA